MRQKTEDVQSDPYSRRSQSGTVRQMEDSEQEEPSA